MLNRLTFKTIVLILQSTLIAQAAVNLSFSLKNYENPRNVDSNGRSCDFFSLFSNNCDPVFEFTVQTTNHFGKTINVVHRKVGPFHNRKYIANVLTASSKLDELPNALRILVDIHDRDKMYDDKIIYFDHKVLISKVGKIELQLGSSVKIKVLIQMECSPNYFGDLCQVYCEAIPDLWNCDHVPGARVCAKSCVHGTCILTETSAFCECFDGWGGEYCTMPIDVGILSTDKKPTADTGEANSRLVDQETEYIMTTTLGTNTEKVQQESIKFNETKNSTFMYQSENITESDAQHARKGHTNLLIPIGVLMSCLLIAIVTTITIYHCRRRKGSLRLSSPTGNSFFKQSSRQMGTKVIFNAKSESARTPILSDWDSQSDCKIDSLTKTTVNRQIEIEDLPAYHIIQPQENGATFVTVNENNEQRRSAYNQFPFIDQAPSNG